MLHRRLRTGKKLPLAIAPLFALLTCLYAQEHGATGSDSLEQLSSSIHKVVAKVSTAVVRIEVLGYSHSSEGLKGDTHLVSKSESIASGVILEGNGYIVTNAHALEGARQVRVVLDPKAHAASGAAQKDKYGASVFEGRVVGIFREADLALLKIDATELPVLALADSDSVQPGELVFAVGNPEGLNNSVSMGVVSAVGRQSEEDRPPIYIQTDAAINAGSSGGALVDIRGNLIGITTFILTEGGGSEGLGFALPSNLVYLVCRELKASSYFRPGEIGLRVQAITVAMASALALPRNTGLVVSDVLSGSPAEAAGVRVQDVVVAVDGSMIDNVAQFASIFYNKRAGRRVELKMLRGSRPYVVTLEVREGKARRDEDALTDKDERIVLRSLCVTVTNLNEKTRSAFPEMRSTSGVLVVDKLAQCDIPTGLEPDDVIRSANKMDIGNVEDLRSGLLRLKPGDFIALQIERHNKLRFVAFELE